LPPYAFRHHLRLQKNVDLFVRRVNESNIAPNVDAAESTLDALMQAIVCGEVVGWRKEARKVLLQHYLYRLKIGGNRSQVIILVTDQDAHFAYDGRMGGITFPNDERCHTGWRSETRSTEYLRALKMDYPSFGQIRKQLNEKNVAVIFAVRGEN